MNFLWWCYLIFGDVLQNEDPSPSFHLLNTLDGLNGSPHLQERSWSHHCLCLTICSHTLFVTTTKTQRRQNMIQSHSRLKNKCPNSPGMGEVILSSCKLSDLNWNLEGLANSDKLRGRGEGHCRWNKIRKEDYSRFHYCVQSEWLSSHAN